MQVVNVTPRYAKLKGRVDNREVIGWENIELIRCTAAPEDVLMVRCLPGLPPWLSGWTGSRRPTEGVLTVVLLPRDSDRPLETMLDEFKRLKDEYPDRILIASIMEVRVQSLSADEHHRCSGAAARLSPRNVSAAA